MGDVGDYWREHKDYKRMMRRKDDELAGEIARGERPHVCFLCQRAFKTEPSLAAHFNAKHVDLKP